MTPELDGDKKSRYENYSGTGGCNFGVIKTESHATNLIVSKITTPESDEVRSRGMKITLKLEVQKLNLFINSEVQVSNLIVSKITTRESDGVKSQGSRMTSESMMGDRSLESNSIVTSESRCVRNQFFC